MHVLSEVSIEIERTLDSGQLREAIDLLQHGVVGNDETCVDGNELRDRDVRQRGVVDEDETASGSEVGSHEGLHGIAVEAEVLRDVGKRWQVNGTAVTERHVLGGLKHGERSRKSRRKSVIGFDVQGTLDGGHLQTDVL